MSRVSDIIDDVKSRGRAAALEYTQLFDGVALTPEALVWNPLEQASAPLDPPTRQAIEFALDRIRRFHDETRPQPTTTSPEPGLRLTERFVPLQRVGLYVPNGAFPLISSLLMTAVPARAAGVPDLVVAMAPRRDPRHDPIWTFVLQKLEVREVLLLGGVQAVAALAYGLEDFRPVDFIAGPGNRYVAEAKQEVAQRGQVGIDLPAGPSEVLILCNQPTLEDFVAADLFAQAEHDPDARGELITLSEELAQRIAERVQTLPAGVGRIRVTRVASLEEMVERANQRAPEHLGLMGKDVEQLADRFWSAGAIFVGAWAGQALGDYVAGPSHVLPTGRTGRFASGLSTRTFLKRISVIDANPAISLQTYAFAAHLAHLEGLDFHEESLRLRHGALQKDGAVN
jgi:histidinol dehydrogenase